MKKFVIMFGCLLLLMTASCGNKFESGYKKIKTQEISEIVEILGKANEKFIATPDMNHNCYYWFDHDYNFKDAKLHSNDEKIMYIGVIIDAKTKKCVGKAYGQVTPDLRPGDINVFA